MAFCLHVCQWEDVRSPGTGVAGRCEHARHQTGMIKGLASALPMTDRYMNTTSTKVSLCPLQEGLICFNNISQTAIICLTGILFG